MSDLPLLSVRSLTRMYGGRVGCLGIDLDAEHLDIRTYAREALVQLVARRGGGPVAQVDHERHVFLSGPATLVFSGQVSLA